MSSIALVNGGLEPRKSGLGRALVNFQDGVKGLEVTLKPERYLVKRLQEASLAALGAVDRRLCHDFQAHLVCIYET